MKKYEDFIGDFKKQDWRKDTGFEWRQILFPKAGEIRKYKNGEFIYFIQITHTGIGRVFGRSLFKVDPNDQYKMIYVPNVHEWNIHNNNILYIMELDEKDKLLLQEYYDSDFPQRQKEEDENREKVRNLWKKRNSI
jgi:glyoxylate carboligase